MSNVNHHKYDDIINLPHHVSRRHAPMPLIDRAAQFSPFAALAGFDAVIQETGRQTAPQAELDESAKAELNEKLQLIFESLPSQPRAVFTCFQQDARKAGGAYVTISGRVKKIDPVGRMVTLEDGTVIPMAQIYGIQL